MSGLVDQHAELHVYIGELGKCVVVAAQRDIAQREQTFLGHRKHMRSHSSDFVQLDRPILELRIGNEFGKAFILDGEDFRNNKRRRLADPCK